jgi:hypothetical protein
MLKMREVTFKNSILIPAVLKLINEGHTVTLPLKGFSMRPFLEDGRDKALLTKVGKLRVGDPVLAIIDHQRYVLHRIVKIEGDNVTLLGDGNLHPEHCKTSDIEASVIGFYRKGRTTLDPIAGWKWKTYSTVWMRLRPIRRWLLAFYRRVWIPIFGYA